MVADPVCGMDVNPKTAKHSKYYKGKMYYFCSPSCKARFEKDPEVLLKSGPVGME